jgi:hypothetical protein
LPAARLTAFLLLAAICVGTALSAHRLDEYLQAARIGIEPDRVRIELGLTPGTAVAEAIVRDIDRDGDGSLAPREQQAYAWQVLKNLELRLDGRSLSIELIEASFPTVATVRDGEGTIAIESEAGLPVLTAGHHQLFFRNTNGAASGVYLANALVPDSDRLAITAQGRDGAQSELTIDFMMRAAPVVSQREWTLAGILAAGIFWVFVRPRIRYLRVSSASS